MPNFGGLFLNDLLFRYEFDPTEEEIEEGCDGQLHPMAEEGIRLFNEGKYWDAHEALETAWIEESGPARALYKGILQAGVMYLQIERNNLRGAYKMHKRCLVWLTPWPDNCRTVNVGQLREDVGVVIAEARRLGEDQLENFDRSLFKRIQRV